jgi:replicative DNA helicase
MNQFGETEVIIGKQRHAPIGMVELSFTPEFTAGNYGETLAAKR